MILISYWLGPMINISKCYILHLDPPYGYDEYNIQGTTISSSDTIKTLVFILTIISNFMLILNHTLAIIRKSFHFTNNQMFITL